MSRRHDWSGRSGTGERPPVGGWHWPLGSGVAVCSQRYEVAVDGTQTVAISAATAQSLYRRWSERQDVLLRGDMRTGFFWQWPDQRPTRVWVKPLVGEAAQLMQTTDTTQSDDDMGLADMDSRGNQSGASPRGLRGGRYAALLAGFLRSRLPAGEQVRESPQALDSGEEIGLGARPGDADWLGRRRSFTGDADMGLWEPDSTGTCVQRILP